MSQDFTDLSKVDSLKAKPKTFPFLSDLRLSNDVVSKLSLNLSRIYSGSDEVYLTPLGKDNSPDDLLAATDSLFTSKSNISSSLNDLEQSNRSKFGPRSIAKPWSERIDSLYDYFKHCKDDQNKYLDASPIGSGGLRPLSLPSGLTYLKANTNSGLPDYTRKSNVIPSLVNSFNDQLKSQYPCVLFTRTQEGGKTRNVWGYPISDTLNEMLFYQPLLSFMRTQKFRSALLGPDHVDKSVSALMHINRSLSRTLLSVDFSSFDATVGYNLQKKSFDLIKSCFQDGYHHDIDYIFYRFNNIGIVTPSGIVHGSHGVPSGATFTNEVDSLSQYLVSINSSVPLTDGFQIQGDDGVYGLPYDRLDEFKSHFKSAGLKLNDDKSYCSNDFCVFLQRLYDFHYSNNGFIGGIYSIYRALNRIIYQERYSDFMDYSLKGKDYYSIRTISILENCKYHPLFKDFVKLIVTKDKYNLKFDSKSLSNYNRMMNSGPGTSGFLNNQFGDNIKGINSFETVKLIRELGY